MTDKALAGAVALVTGASSGIGAASARSLAARGAAVALVARRRDRLAQLADELADLGGSGFVIEADITRPEHASGAVQDTVERLQRLDILINNAGRMLLGTALHSTTDQWDRMIALNVTGLLHITHAAVPYLIDAAATSPRRVADIVNVGSTAGRVARPASSVYTFTKFGLNGFAESLRQELIEERVRVSVIEPGTVDTELVDHLSDETRDAVRRQVTAIEPLQPEDVADAIAYIVTRHPRIAINNVLLRATTQTW